jgi:hypothetical protein
MQRLASHGRGTGLIFARTDTAFFHDTVWRKGSAALFLRGRIIFLRADGIPAENDGGAPSVLVAYGDDDADRLYRSGLEGHFVPLSSSAMIFVAARLEDASPVGITWREVVTLILQDADSALSIAEITAVARRHAKASGNRHVDAKVRQVLQGKGFERTAPRQYALTLSS